MRCFFWRWWFGRLYFLDVLGRWSSIAVLNFKTDPFSFFECSETLHLNCSVVNKQIAAFIFFDKAVPLPITKPFYSSF